MAPVKPLADADNTDKSLVHQAEDVPLPPSRGDTFPLKESAETPKKEPQRAVCISATPPMLVLTNIELVL